MDYKKWTSATNILGFLILVSFVVQIFIPEYTEDFAFDIERVLFEPYRLVTNVFLHLGFLHLFLNVYPLLVFGNVLEEKIGKKQLLLIFFMGGIAGDISQVIAGNFGFGTLTKSIGASGAISAILGAAVLTIPKKDVNLFLIKMKVQTALILFLIYEFIGVLGIYTFQANTLHSTHFGALIFGYFYIWFFRKKELEE